MLEHYDYVFKMYEKYMEIVELIFKCNGNYDFVCNENRDALCILLKDNGFKVKIDEECIFVSLY